MLRKCGPRLPRDFFKISVISPGTFVDVKSSNLLLNFHLRNQKSLMELTSIIPVILQHLGLRKNAVGQKSFPNCNDEIHIWQKKGWNAVLLVQPWLNSFVRFFHHCPAIKPSALYPNQPRNKNTRETQKHDTEWILLVLLHKDFISTHHLLAL